MEKGKWLSSFDLLASSLELRFSDVNANKFSRIVTVCSKQRDLGVHLLPTSKVSSSIAMHLQRASLRSFLFSAKAALKNVSQQSSPVTFVIGNESAGKTGRCSQLAFPLTVSPDLDSLCSAVVLAYLRTCAPTSKSDTLYIPLSNIPRAELSLRTELIPVLSHANIKPSMDISSPKIPHNIQML